VASSWWPKALKRTHPEPRAVPFATEVVTAWGPPNSTAAGQDLATCHRYCLLRLELGDDLDPPQSTFSEDNIEAYLAGPPAQAPTGTRKRSHPLPAPVSTPRARLSPGAPRSRSPLMCESPSA
jgi:hypothetical protein